MKKAVIFLSIVVACLLVAGCSADVGAGDYSVNVFQDDKTAIEHFGDVYGIYDAGNSKFVNGQSVSENFKDLDGNYLDLVFNGYLVAYNYLVPAFAQYVNTLEFTNAKRHQNYGITEWKSGVTYVEYCTYRFRSTGAVCYAEIRVFDGDFETGYKNNADHYYAKSIRFDPLLRYDLTRKVVISTGNPISSYDPLKQTAVIYDYLPNADCLTQAFAVISSSMDVHPNTVGGKVIIKENNNRRMVSAFGICSKSSVNNSEAVSNLYNKSSDSMFLSKILAYDGPFDFDENYYFDLSCILDDENNPTNYHLRIINNPEQFEVRRSSGTGNIWFASHETYTPEEFSEAFSSVN